MGGNSGIRRLKLLLVIGLAIVFSGTARGAGLSASGFFPANGAGGVCIDTPLRITFSTPPVVGSTGKIQVFDAADNKVVDTIDVSSRFGQRMVGGQNRFNYFPVVITGN